MSIACPMFDSHVSTLDRVREESPKRVRAKRPVSAKRVEANRRNARRSTGPRTTAGKARASRNALKHGLCGTFSRLPSEEQAAFETFLSELEGEMRPRTVLQRHLFPQIANLLWRVRRLPDAETALFVRESGKAAVDETETLSSAEVLARRFSDEPASNGFLLMGRYERGMQNALMRMIKQFHSLQKTHPTSPYADGDGRCPREGSEPAWSAEKARAQRESFERAREQADREEIERVRNPREPHDPGERRKYAKLCATVEHAFDAREAHLKRDAEAFEREYGVPLDDPMPQPLAGSGADEKRTQTEPTQNLDSEALAGKCPTLNGAPVTERTHCAGEDEARDASGEAVQRRGE